MPLEGPGSEERDFFNELDDMGAENGARMAEQVKDYMDMIEDKQIPFVEKQFDSLKYSLLN